MKVLIILAVTIMCVNCATKSCISTTKVNRDQVHKIFENDFKSTDNKIKDFVLCGYKKIFYLDSRNNFDKEEALLKTPKENREDFKKASNICANESGKNQAEKAWNIAKCFGKEYYSKSRPNNGDAWQIFSCHEKYPPNEALIDQIVSEGKDEFNFDKEQLTTTKNFYLCMFEKGGAISKDGNLNKDAFLATFNHIPAELGSKSFDNCKHTNGGTNLDKVWNFIKCTTKHN